MTTRRAPPPACTRLRRAPRAAAATASPSTEVRRVSCLLGGGSRSPWDCLPRARLSTADADDATAAAAAAAAAEPEAAAADERALTPDSVRWAALWQPLRALELAGACDAHAAALLRAVAVRLGVSWVELLREADALLGEADAADCVGWVLGRWAGFDNLTLSSGPSREVRGAAASAAGLRRVSPAVGLQLVVGVSGLLSPHEGDMAVKKQPQQLSLCWAGAASYFRAADWWSLAWGAEPLGALAAVVRGGGDGLGHALAARGVWARCYAAAKEAGTLLAEQLRARVRRAAGDSRRRLSRRTRRVAVPRGVSGAPCW